MVGFWTSDAWTYVDSKELPGEGSQRSLVVGERQTLWWFRMARCEVLS